MERSLEETTVSNSPLPVESHRMFLIPLAVSCENMYEIFVYRSLLETQLPRLLFGAGH